MNNIELIFNNDSVLLSIDNILSITSKKWFLLDILNAHINNYDSNKINIYEDKDLALSLIETMRYNKIILLNKNIDVKLLLLLAKKWRVPDKFINLIENNLSEKNNNLITFNPILNYIIFQCINCKMGFKLHENKIDSCICHPKCLNHISHKFNCCGKYSGSEPCSKGYHCLSQFDTEKIINLLKEKK